MTVPPAQLARALRQRLERLPARRLAPIDVVVIDSGIDARHPDLAGRIAAAFIVEMNGGSARVAEHPPDSDADLFGHGTAVASIVASVAPNARIIDVRVLGADNAGTGDALVAGLALAVERRWPVINMSLACKASFAGRLHELCEQAYRQGQTVVAAKRNMPLVDNGFPAELSSCISVDRARFRSFFELRYRPDEPIEYVARGELVRVAAQGGGYTVKTGTSFATPAVSGLVALLLGADPSLRSFEVKALLKAHADELAHVGVRGSRPRRAATKKARGAQAQMKSGRRA